ncbi:Transducin/WD40 repeat-like superfamily protein [Euphorbia peplus]|nr:Transducin/WD40 repeat-like superfamily protein [Euphorbia peplus]
MSKNTFSKHHKDARQNKQEEEEEDQEEEEEEEEEDDQEEEDHFYESLDRIASSSCSCSCSGSNSDSDPDPNPTHSSSSYDHAFAVPKFPMGVSKYDVWISEPASVSERRQRLLLQMGLTPNLNPNPNPEQDFPVSRSVSSDYLTQEQPGPVTSTCIVRSKSDGADRDKSIDDFSLCSTSSSSSLVSCYSPRIDLINVNNCNGNTNDKDTNNVVVSKKASSSLNKPPSGKYGKKMDMFRSDSTNLNGNWNSGEGFDCNGDIGNAATEASASQACTIKNLDNGKEFVVNEIKEDGTWNKLKEVGTGRQLTMEEFEISVGHSPIVQELMRRQNVEDGNREKNNLGASNSNTNVKASVGGGSGGGVSKHKKKGSWFRSIKSVATSVKGSSKERRSSDERDTGSEKGGRRSSSATDDSQDVSFHGPERVRVRQYSKSFKELTALYKTQEVPAHYGSIWSIKFSLDGRYLASAGEDCVIHVWQVTESDRKGDLLIDKPDDANFNFLFANGSPEPSLLSPTADEKKRRGRSSISRKSLSLDHILVPETVFALSDKPICSFRGHLDDVLDLSWSKSQHLLSSSMDKTVRLWHLSSKCCLKTFSHSDYVTCIQFNPVDDGYFISGSLDAKVRIWSISDHQVVDWSDLHEMVTAACYSPDGQGALVGTYKGTCRLYSTSENKLQQKSQINLQNKKKKPHLKKITGFQFARGSSSEVLITSADSRIRVIDGVDLVHKFKGFRNTNSQISASLASNGKYVVSASEDSYVYVWKHEADSRPSRGKGVTVTRSYEHFHCQDVSMAIPWPGMGDTWPLQDAYLGERNGANEVSIANHPPTPVEDGSRTLSGRSSSPLNGIICSATNGYFFDRISATWPEEKLTLATRKTKSRTPSGSFDICSGMNQKTSAAYGMVIVTAGRGGEIRTYQNFGLPVRI